MADISAAGDRKLRVFISYSRKDEDCAQELLAGLEVVGFEPYLDKHDIAAAALDQCADVVSPPPFYPPNCAISVRLV